LHTQAQITANIFLTNILCDIIYTNHNVSYTIFADYEISGIIFNSKMLVVPKVVQIATLEELV